MYVNYIKLRNRRFDSYTDTCMIWLQFKSQSYPNLLLLFFSFVEEYDPTIGMFSVIAIH